MSGGSDLVHGLVAGRVDSALEGDGERVQRGLPAHRPSCLALASGVEGPGDEVETLQRGLVLGEMAAGLDRAAVAGIQAFDRVCAADDAPDLDVVEAVAECVSCD